MVFLSIDSVLQYPTLDDLKYNNMGLYNNWINIEISNDYGADSYQLKALRYPEYNKIVSIAYGIVNLVNGEIKRKFTKFANNTESFIIENFIDYLNNFDQNTNNIFCGFGLTKNRFPLLIKRILLNKKDLMDGVQIPVILKKILSTKPWENNNAIDIDDLWKFNGMYTNSITSISSFLNFKTNAAIMSDYDISNYYWNNVSNDEDNTIATIALQSVNKVNIAMQLMNEFRTL
jgi:hypothetical protein